MKIQKTIRRFFSKQRFVVAGLSLIGLVISVLIAGLFAYNETVEIPFIKLRFHARGELDPHPSIRIIAIDDNTISEFQNVGVSYPFPRKLQGILIRRLADNGVKAACFDLLFDMNSLYGIEDDEALRDSIEYAKSKGMNVILAAALPEMQSGEFSQVTFLGPNATLMESEPVLGLANTATTAGDKGKGSYRDRERAIARHFENTYYSQATEMYKLVLAEEGEEFNPVKHGIDANGLMYVNYFNGNQKHIKTVQYVQLFPELLAGVNPLTEEKADTGSNDEWEEGETAQLLEGDSETEQPAAEPPAAETTPVDETAADSTGDTEWEEGETAKRFELNAETSSSELLKDLAGTYVFVGSFSEADNDYFSTPFNDKMFGVETNASAFQTFLTGMHIHLVPVWLTVLVLVIVSLLAGQLGYFLPSRWWSPVVGAGILVLLVAIGFEAFIIWRLLFNLSYTIFSFAMCYAATLAYKVMTEEREKARIRKTFGRYVSEAVVNEIISNPKLASLGGEDRRVAVLFSDIRSFSTISELMTPHDILSFLNEYFEITSQVIDANNGYIDKFMGDGIMAVFGAPVPTDNPTLDAVKCALDMVKNLHEKVHYEMRRLNVPEFEIGVGIHFGHVIMGNIGSQRRTDYSIIGDAVNLASRLESLTKEFKKAIIVSEEVYEIIGNDLTCKFLATVKVKGREQDENIYYVEHPDNPDMTVLKGVVKAL